MTQPSKEQWDDVKLKLSSPIGSAFFKCDDYLISAHIEQVKMTLKVAVYVNGWFKVKWLWHGKECDIGQMGEIPRRFFCLKKKKPKAKDVEFYEMILSKKKCKEQGVYQLFCWTSGYFSTSGAFITHLKKHNPSIEILDFEAYQSALAALPVTDEQT